MKLGLSSRASQNIKIVSSAGALVQWRRSGLKSAGGTNPWRALEILKNDKNLGGQPVLASPTANSGGTSPRDLRPCPGPLTVLSLDLSGYRSHALAMHSSRLTR
jgi:hypothetical protein